MRPEEFVEKLEGVIRTSNGWQGLCPSHDDNCASLSVGTDGGKTLIYCHAGCTAEEVVGTLGLKISDLYASQQRENTLEARYDYEDLDGELLFQIQRFSGKHFRARRPDGSRGWIPNVKGIELVPYRLPDICASGYAFIVEGEKDADTGTKQLRVPTTTNPFGAGKWRPEYNHHFAGKNVVLIPDDDEVGAKHMQNVARSLFGTAKRIKIVELPFGHDLSEWWILGGTRAQLVEILRKTPPVTSEQIHQWQQEEQPAKGYQFESIGELMRQPAKKRRWVVQGLLPAGGLGMVAAKPKAGKSTAVRCLAFAVARGERFLGRKTIQGTVLYLAPQEMKEEVADHFTKLGATGNEPLHVCCDVKADSSIADLEAVITRYKPQLVVIDQIFHVIDIKDEQGYAAVTKALRPLEALARSSNVHFLITYHCGKSERADPADAVLGSTAFFGAMDSLLLMKQFPNYRTLQSRQRYKDENGDMPETVLNFDEKTCAITLGEPRDDAEIERIGENMAKFFLQHRGEQLTEDQLLAQIEGGHAFKRKALRQLISANKIGRTGKGVRGNPFFYFHQ